MATTDPIKNTEQLRAMTDYYLKRRQFRNHALLVLGVYTALRISDLLRLKWTDVYNEKAGVFRTHLTIVEHKTSKKKIVALNPDAIHALSLCLPNRRGDYLFESKKCDQPISRTQAWRIIKDAATAVGIDGVISCHSLRKTWGYHAWTSQMVSPVVIMDIYNHSNYEITRRYLGVAQDDLDRAYLDMHLF